MNPQTLKLRDGGIGGAFECELDGNPIKDVVSYKIEGAFGHLTLFTVTVYVGEVDGEMQGEVMGIDNTDQK